MEDGGAQVSIGLGLGWTAKILSPFLIKQVTFTGEAMRPGLNLHHLTTGLILKTTGQPKRKATW